MDNEEIKKRYKELDGPEIKRPQHTDQGITTGDILWGLLVVLIVLAVYYLGN